MGLRFSASENAFCEVHNFCGEHTAGAMERAMFRRSVDKDVHTGLRGQYGLRPKRVTALQTVATAGVIGRDR